MERRPVCPPSVHPAFQSDSVGLSPLSTYPQALLLRLSYKYLVEPSSNRIERTEKSEKGRTHRRRKFRNRGRGRDPRSERGPKRGLKGPRTTMDARVRARNRDGRDRATKGREEGFRAKEGKRGRAPRPGVERTPVEREAGRRRRLTPGSERIKILHRPGGKAEKIRIVRRGTGKRSRKRGRSPASSKKPNVI